MTFINHGQFDGDTPARDGPLERNDHAARLPRANTFLGAELQWSGVSRRCQVRDLSEGGALLVVDAAPAKGTRVLLVRGSHRLGSTIVWSDAKRCGLRFDHPVIVTDLISGKGTSPAATPVRAATHIVSAEVIGELCALADRLAAASAIGGSDPSLQADSLALAHALHRIRTTPDAT